MHISLNDRRNISAEQCVRLLPIPLLHGMYKLILHELELRVDGSLQFLTTLNVLRMNNQIVAQADSYLQRL
ncbi:hypothetical protein D3C85_1845520 [compost metagenome]